MFQRKRQARNDQPDDIQKKRTCTATILYLFSKRKETECRKLKALQSDRNSNHRDAPETSCQAPAQPAHCSAKHKPQYISQTSHMLHLPVHLTFYMIHLFPCICDFALYHVISNYSVQKKIRKGKKATDFHAQI